MLDIYARTQEKGKCPKVDWIEAGTGFGSFTGPGMEASHARSNTTSYHLPLSYEYQLPSTSYPGREERGARREERGSARREQTGFHVV